MRVLRFALALGSLRVISVVALLLFFRESAANNI